MSGAVRWLCPRLAVDEACFLRLFEDSFDAIEECAPLTFEDGHELVFEVASLRLLEPFPGSAVNGVTPEIPTPGRWMFRHPGEVIHGGKAKEFPG
ncbi:hypothetical protein, partial [Streptomyces hokutonensis]|uniref:hypothetical protein n=1 Tax=Streptomyces hokutonensis TaxID=1306990 RepID=UPI0033D46662